MELKTTTLPVHRFVTCPLCSDNLYLNYLPSAALTIFRKEATNLIYSLVVREFVPSP